MTPKRTRQTAEPPRPSDPKLKEFIDRVIVPTLAEKLLFESRRPATRDDGTKVGAP